MAWTDLRDLRFEDIEDRVQRYADHAYLRTLQVRPVVSRFHFEAARTILNAAGVPSTTAVPVLTAVLLVQAGLSMHDKIDRVDGVARQLHVLAGDYCSSWYYAILAGVGDEALLAALCDAVVRINEAKMTCYLAMPEIPSQQYMALQEIIQGALLMALAKHYLPDAGWLTHVQSLVRGYIVKRETAEHVTPRYFTLRQAHEWLSEARDRVLRLPASVRQQPFALYVAEYLGAIKSSLERESLAEGNR
ncbi:heptaprenyl diphosphate synthase component 1 [Alicyclobacillus sp.]|uniref:heptaprenyl diphosphate synthase component 1 n=1 Tax=Alicyclobacillus sp. TaxID=61169 RepID=UPI0025C0A397|nr:heptaprenyl diphosphate synthase component 1 [Alicyclobacillus sp.]MCL6515573.1 heptaprenyl diphosphate synthase component 1 [Alicyclobacillus sp.]